MRSWTEEGIASAWRALARSEAAEEWRFVHLADFGNVSVEAGCRFPRSLEALIVSFPGLHSVSQAELPEGKGFDLSCIEHQTIFDGKTAIALVRRPEGPTDIFAIIVVDVLRALEAAASDTSRDLIQAFIQRVKSWQEFMSRSHRPLSVDAQIGLLGELWLLRTLTNTSVGAGALDWWQGPLRAAQDFCFRGFAVEVKSTIRAGNFLARINSIDQLDNNWAPVFLCAFRFEESPDGESLVELVAELRKRFEKAGVRRRFDALLMVMGYLDEHAGLYKRALTLKDARAYLAEGDMPRLTRGELPAAIRSASYVLDLDALATPSIGLSEMTNQLGLD